MFLAVVATLLYRPLRSPRRAEVVLLVAPMAAFAATLGGLTTAVFWLVASLVVATSLDQEVTTSSATDDALPTASAPAAALTGR